MEEGSENIINLSLTNMIVSSSGKMSFLFLRFNFGPEIERTNILENLLIFAWKIDMLSQKKSTAFLP